MQVLSSQEEQAYRDFLAAHPHTYITQSFNWPQVKRNWSPVRFFEYDSETKQIVGVAQLLILKKPTGGGIAYLPRGPVTDTPDERTFPVIKSLVHQAYQYAKSQGLDRLRVDPQWYSSDLTLDLLSQLAAAFPGGKADSQDHRLQGQPKYSMILDLRPFAEYQSYLAALNSKHRYYIRRTVKEGIKAYISQDPLLVEDLFRLIKMTCQRQGISYRPKEYFYDLCSAFKTAFFSVAEYQGRRLSVSLNVECGDTVHNLYAGNDLSYRSLRLPMAMNPRFIQEAFERKLSFVDFGGIFGLDERDGLYAFKRQFMPADQQPTVYAGEVEYRLN